MMGVFYRQLGNGNKLVKYVATPHFVNVLKKQATFEETTNVTMHNNNNCACGFINC